MSENTKIEWADNTYNPWIGCTKVGPGCDNCYAEADFDKRRHVVTWGAGQPRKRTKTWGDPVKWNALRFFECIRCGWRGSIPGVKHDPMRMGFYSHTACGGDLVDRRPRIFCASLADVFDNEAPGQWRQNLMTLVSDTPNLDRLFLTKRIGNAARMLSDAGMHDGRLLTANDDYRPPDNLWIGATIINQEEADRDIPKLLAVPAAKRFLSMEPLLGPVDLSRWLEPAGLDTDLGLSNPGIDWVIVGGESGPNARPMHPDWARGLRDQCEAAGVPFLFKQWGEWEPISNMEESKHGGLYKSRVTAKPHEDQSNLDDIYGKSCTVPFSVIHLDGSLHDITEPNAFISGAMQTFKIGKKAAGRLLDGRTWDGVPA